MNGTIPRWGEIIHLLRNRERFNTVNDLKMEQFPAQFRNILKMYLNTCKDKICEGISPKDIISKCDDLLTIHWAYSKCTTIFDYERTCVLAYRLIVGGQLHTDLLGSLKDSSVVQGEEFFLEYAKRDLCGNTIQSSSIEDFIGTLRQCVDGVKSVNSAPIVKKLVAMYSYLLVHGYLKKIGFEVTETEYNQLERKALYATYSDKKDLWLCVFDTTLFICEKLLEFRQTGEISVFFHNSSTYTKWIIAADKLSALSGFTSNLEAHGTNYFKFVAELDHLIEQGTAYAKFTSVNDGVESKVIRARLSNLICIKNTEITKRAAQKERAAPFGVLVYGGSSVGKSLFSRVLFHYYGQLHDLETSDHYRYVRCPSDDFWSNFDSSKWCIQLDDVAFQAPGLGNDVDSTLKEVINVVNNVPYVPPQADLADKGKTPVLAKLVIATTNTIHMNTQQYFSCPLAVQRRLPFVVTVTPKECYLQENRQFMNPEALPDTFDEYPDFWDITVSRIEPDTRDGNMKDPNAKWIAKIVAEKHFSDINEFLAYFGQKTLEHSKNQDQSAACEDAMRNITLCRTCLFRIGLCKCEPNVNFRTTTPPDLPKHLFGPEDESKEDSDPGWFSRIFKKDPPLTELEQRLKDLKKGKVQHQIVELEHKRRPLNTREFISICILILWWYFIPWNPIALFWFIINTFIFVNTYTPWFLVFLYICYRHGWLDSTTARISDFVTSGAYVTFIKDCFHQIIYITVNWKHYMWLQKRAAKYRFWRAFIITHVFPFYDPVKQMSLLGKWHSIKKQSPKLKSLVKIIAGLSFFYASYKMHEVYNNTKKKKEDNKEVDESVVYEPQGGVFSAEDQLPKEQSRNVWYTSTIELSRFDAPLPSNSMVGASGDQLRNVFGANCLRFKIKPIYADKKATIGTEICGVVVGQNYCLTNNHAFDKDAESYEINVISMSTAEGISSNLFMKLKASNLIRNVEKDICLFRVVGSPFRNILRFWDKGGKEFNNNRALYLTRNRSGNVDKTEIHNIVYSSDFPVEDLSTRLPIYMGRVQNDEATKNGDCGSLAIAMTPQGAILIGIHVMAHGTTVGTNAIVREDIQQLIDRHQEKYPSIVIQGGGIPIFECEEKKHILGPSHHKSTARYISQGTAKYYGSFVGWRARPSTKIQSTPLQQKMVEHFGKKVDHGPPVMTGWQPWHNNLIDMLDPTELHDPDTLQECMLSFSDDIIKCLGKESPGWEKELMFLSKQASVNGLEGVKYIDRINSNTSMGFPWNTTKNNYIIPAPTEKHPDGITFVQEVWDNYDRIFERYKTGQRWYPVFMGHLKDEARPFKKIREAKTRMFTGAPIDWTLAMRSCFLTFVRLFQKNKFIFEAGPGTACQSTEWGDIYYHITYFGVDRMVAGDFGKYDKSLRATWILAAFHVIINVYRAAGFTDEQILILCGFATDTAYPLVNVFGELWEFFMSNSSGHSLTVIINSLDNSLYMRYAYYILNPNKECHTFKQNVRLFTYGDDNIMGVSKNCPWFNHTSIQKVLGDIGINYTMADKEAASVEYLHIKDCTFLKRSWRMDEDTGFWFCPLEESSIFKSLTVWLPSKSISPEAQMVAIIYSANTEFFFYGRERFEKEHAFFKSILAEYPYKYYAGNGLPNWDELVTRFKQASGIDEPCLEGLGRSEDSTTGHKTE